ncbi:MAG: SRPBCC family protein [Rhodocyclaceae bacterium]
MSSLLGVGGAGRRSAEADADREIVVTRVFDAPRELVWRAMTDPQHVVNWWGPHGFSTTITKMDVRPGGVWKHTMHGPDGTDYPNSSVFREVVEHERIVYSHGGGREGGAGAHFVATWLFEDLDGKTRLTLRMVFDSKEALENVCRDYGAREGAGQTLQRLADYLPTLSAI